MNFTMYFAGSQGEEFDNTMLDMGCARLFSQLNDRKQIARHLDLITNRDNKTFIDSGAYTAFNSGKDVDLDNYISYIDEIGENITCFANLDVIPKGTDTASIKEGCEEGYKNFIYIQEHCKYGYKCNAVYHRKDPVEYLYKYIDIYKQNPKMNYIALGGMATTYSEDAFRFGHKYCAIIKKHLPNVNIHLFGCTRLNHIEHIKCESTDSTTWIKASIYGTVITPWGRLNISERRSDEACSVHNFDLKSRAVVYAFIESLGFTIDEITNDPEKRIQYNVKYLMEWCKNYKYKPVEKLKNTLI